MSFEIYRKCLIQQLIYFLNSNYRSWYAWKLMLKVLIFYRWKQKWKIEMQFFRILLTLDNCVEISLWLKEVIWWFFVQEFYQSFNLSKKEKYSKSIDVNLICLIFDLIVLDLNLVLLTKSRVFWRFFENFVENFFQYANNLNAKEQRSSDKRVRLSL